MPNQSIRSVPKEPSAEDIARALGARQTGRGRWMARCVAHVDKTPSLSITEGRNGRPLLHDFGGCKQSDVIAALRERGLWPTREYNPVERRAWATRREQDNADERAERWWSLAVLALVDELLEQLGSCDPERAAVTDLLVATRTAPLDEYRTWRQRWPELTGALADAGQRYDERKQVLLARRLMGDVDDGSWE